MNNNKKRVPASRPQTKTSPPPKGAFLKSIGKHMKSIKPPKSPFAQRKTR